MQKLQVSFETWERHDADGLFDYQQETEKRKGTFVIEESGFICRNKSDFSLIFTNKSQEKVKYQPILKLKKQHGHFILYSLNVENESLCSIVSKEASQAYCLKKSDKIRLGKVQIQIIDLSFSREKTGIYYEQAKVQLEDQKVDLVREITPSFYVKGEEEKYVNQSMIDDNPSCRYCYSKTVTDDNPFIVSCFCNGSTRYIHQNCLLEWLLKRGQLNEIKGKGIFYADSKIFKCEICHHFFYIPQMWKKIYDYQVATLKNLTETRSDEVLILHIKYEHESIYFINLNKPQTISMGRALGNEIIINELSVSRQHAIIEIDPAKKIVKVKDNKSKFGTVALYQNVEIQNNSIYQVGRSRMIFKIHKKKSLFEKLSVFCLTKENLQNDRKFSRELLHMKN